MSASNPMATLWIAVRAKMDQLTGDFANALDQAKAKAGAFAAEVEAETSNIGVGVNELSDAYNDTLNSALQRIGMSYQEWAGIADESIGQVMAATDELGNYMPERLQQAAQQTEAESSGMMAGIVNTMSDPAALMKIGMAFTMISIPLMQVIGKYQSAQSQFTAAAENAGESAQTAAGQLKTESDAMQGLGKNTTDTASALNNLITGGVAPTQAMSYMGLVANMAARQHKTLADAAQDLVKILNGAPMVARQYGVDLSGLIDPTTELAKNSKVLATAQNELQTAQDAVTVSNLSAQDALDKTKTTTKDNSAAITSAQNEMTNATAAQAAAQERLNTAEAESQAQLASKTTNAAKTQAEAHQRVTTAQAALDKANERVAAATAKLTGLQEKGAVTSKTVAAGHGQTAVQAFEAAQKEEKFAAAQAKVNQLQAEQEQLQAKVNAGITKNGQVVDILTNHLNGQAAASVDNFSGKLKILWARVYNDVTPALSKAAPVVSFLGPAFMGAAGAMTVMPALFSGIASGASAIASGAVAVGGAIADMGAAALAAVPDVIAFMIPWLPWILLAAAVIVIGYIIYRNWKTIWKALGEFAHSAWNDVIKPVWEAIKFGFKEVVDYIKFNVDIWIDAFHLVEDAGKFLWNDVIKPIFGAITRAIHDVSQAFKDLGNVVGTVAGPIMSVFKSGGSVLSTVMSHIPGFAEGGTVPGPIGHAALIMAHGGETISNGKHGQGGTTVVENHYHVRGSILGQRDLAKASRQSDRDQQQYAGNTGFRGAS